MRVVRTTNIGKLIDRLALMDISSYAITQDGSKPYTDLDLCGPVALVLGGEGKGIRPGVVKKCQDQACIPMRGKIRSLNVSAAAAIALFEVVRQREKIRKSKII
jgi:23S rRNA (guanosine2251-2'-O)-methyltransferase